MKEVKRVRIRIKVNCQKLKKINLNKMNMIYWEEEDRERK